MYDLEQLLSDEHVRAGLISAVRDGKPPPLLRSVKIKVTARCNLRCVMCKYGRGEKPPELDTARFLALIDELVDAGTRKVHFSGGEVFMRRDFIELAGRAAERNMKVAMTSNLTLLTKEKAKRLLHHKINSISTSLDGATRKSHEAVRGIPGSFKKTVNGIELLRAVRERRGQKTRLRVNFVMMRQNFRDYPKLLALAGDLGVTDVVPMPVDSSDVHVRLSKRLMREYNEAIAPEVHLLRERYGFSTHESLVYPFGRSAEELKASKRGRYAHGEYKKELCFAPWLHMFIAWNGLVYLCCMTNGKHEPVGDLSSQSVREVFCGERFEALRAAFLQERLKPCHRCDMMTKENRFIRARLPELAGTSLENNTLSNNTSSPPRRLTVL